MDTIRRVKIRAKKTENARPRFERCRVDTLSGAVDVNAEVAVFIHAADVDACHTHYQYILRTTFIFTTIAHSFTLLLHTLALTRYAFVIALTIPSFCALIH